MIASRPVRSVAILAAIGILLSALIVDGAHCRYGSTLHGQGHVRFNTVEGLVLWPHWYVAGCPALDRLPRWLALSRVFGIKAPADHKYVCIAAVFGIFFAFVMTAVDYAHNLAMHTPPEHFSLTVTNVIGLLSFEGFYASTVEEILFRMLLVTFLMQCMSGRIRLDGFNLHIPGVIVAVLFCLSHVASFWTESFSAAAGQQLYAFIWGNNLRILV